MNKREPFSATFYPNKEIFNYSIKERSLDAYQKIYEEKSINIAHNSTTQNEESEKNEKNEKNLKIGQKSDQNQKSNIQIKTEIVKAIQPNEPKNMFEFKFTPDATLQTYKDYISRIFNFFVSWELMTDSNIESACKSFIQIASSPICFILSDDYYLREITKFIISENTHLKIQLSMVKIFFKIILIKIKIIF